MSDSRMIRSAGAPALLLAALGLIAAAAPARAQAPADGRWLPWLGCWEAMAPAGQRTVTTPAQLCIHANAGARGVTFANLVGGKVLGEHEVVADGARHPVAEGGCRGWETAVFSQDAHRVFRRTELDCDGGGRRVSTGVIAFLPDDQWVEVDAAGLPHNRGVRVMRYRALAPSAAAATGLLPQGEDLAIQTARAAAAAPLLTADVIEASRRLDSEALQALVFQRGNGYGLDARSARQLADARVSADVIDLMVALSYPDFFDVNRGTAIALRNEPSGGGGSGRVPGPWGGWGCYGYDSYYGYPGYGYPGWIYSYPLGYGMYNPCWGGGYGPYGGLWGWGGGWGYGPYGGIVDVGGNGNGGKIVKGHGYSPPSGSGSTGRTARPRGGSASPGGSASVGSSGKSGGSSPGRSGSSGGSSSGSSSSGGRTAHPKH